jgi:phi LC3 family holin
MPLIIDFLIELKDSIDRHGIRWGVLFTLFAVYRKERRNYHLDRRDERHHDHFTEILANQRAIMDKLGVVPCADTLNRTTEPSHPRGVGGYLFSLEEKLTARFARKSMNSNMRRKRKMNQNINYVTLIPALIGVLKLVLQPFGIDLSHITDQQVNDVVNGVSALLAIVGVFMSHRKPEQVQQSPSLPNPPYHPESFK